jgi:hypothetical protein
MRGLAAAEMEASKRMNTAKLHTGNVLDAIADAMADRSFRSCCSSKKFEASHCTCSPFQVCLGANSTHDAAGYVCKGKLKDTRIAGPAVREASKRHCIKEPSRHNCKHIAEVANQEVYSKHCLWGRACTHSREHSP